MKLNQIVIYKRSIYKRLTIRNTYYYDNNDFKLSNLLVVPKNFTIRELQNVSD